MNQKFKIENNESMWNTTCKFLNYKVSMSRNATQNYCLTSFCLSSLLTTAVFPIGVCADLDLCTVTTMFWRSVRGLLPTSPSYPIVMNLFDFLLDVVNSAAADFRTLPAEVGVRMNTIAFSSVIVVVFLALLPGVAARCAEILADFLLLATGPNPLPTGFDFTFS